MTAALALLQNIFRILLISGLFSLVGCGSTPPEELDNICKIFDEKSKWYKKARRASNRWGTSIPVMMAFVHQESKFQAKAKPPVPAFAAEAPKALRRESRFIKGGRSGNRVYWFTL